MKLYLYCSSGTLLEYFTLNKIVCNAYLSMKNRKVIPSLGLISNKFLFLTPKKLRQEMRNFGFEQDYMEIPAVLEFSISDNDAARFPVLAVNEKGNVADSFAMLSEVSEPCMGVFVQAELSFSFVSRILFDNDNAKDDIYRPSSDLYFPEHLYDIIDDSFTEDLTSSVISVASKHLDEKFSELDVCNVILNRTKTTSIVLNTILETKSWPFGEKHTANFDAITMDLMGRSEDLKELTGDDKGRIQDVESDIILGQIRTGEASKSLAAFFQALIRELIPISLSTFSQADFRNVIDKVLDCVGEIYTETEQHFLENTIVNIEDLVYGSSAHSLEAMLDSMKDTWGVLKALVFFLRSPKSCDKLADGLTAYKAASDVQRYAWIMFSALNGLEPISAEKKSNCYVMRIAENIAMQYYPADNIVSFASSTIGNEEKPFVPHIEEELSAECIQSFIMSEAYSSHLTDLITRFAKNKTLSKGFKEKEYVLIKNPSAIIEEWMSKYSAVENISPLDLEKLITALQSHVKKSKSKYDTKRFISDYIENNKVFATLYKKDETFWKDAYKRGKKQ